MNLTKVAQHVVEQRYLDEDETFDDRIGSVAEAAASVENDSNKWARKFYNEIDNQRFIPSSPIMMSCGKDKPFASACNTVPIGDSMYEIMQAATQQALILKYGGGCGFNFGTLRSRGTSIADTGGTASGPCSFMDIYAAVSRTVEQGGRRRGANMGILPVDHPDVIEFINLKVEKPHESYLEEFNLSVGIYDSFM
mgnify:FL=1